MIIRITENQKVKLLTELSPKSSGVQEFIEMVKSTPGLLKFLGFNSHKSLQEYIYDSSQKEFEELKNDADKFEKAK